MAAKREYLWRITQNSAKFVDRWMRVVN